MVIQRDKYLNDLVIRMNNGAIKVITGIRRCGKTYLVFDLFREYLRESGVPDGNVIEIALDDEANAELRDAKALNEHLRSRIGDDGTYYVLLDEVQYAITNRELRDPDSPSRPLRRAQRPYASRQRGRLCHGQQLEDAFQRRADRVSRTWR